MLIDSWVQLNKFEAHSERLSGFGNVESLNFQTHTFARLAITHSNSTLRHGSL